MQPHGPWTILSSRQVYADPWLEVRRDEVLRPDGTPGTHCLARLKAGVSVLALDADHNVYLTQEFHYAVGRETLEVVSGGCEPDESPLLTARRELQEELGISAERWDDFGVTDPFTSVVLSPTRMFLARDLTFGPTRLEATELIACRKLLLTAAVDAVMRCEITHAPSCLLILKAARLLGA